MAHPVHADRDVVKGVDLKVKRGEIVGIAGLMGAGRTELAMSVFGRAYGQRIRGEVLMHGKPIDVSTIQQGHRPRHRLRHRGSQEPGAAAGGRHPPQHQPGQPEGGVVGRRDRRRRRVRRRGRDYKRKLNIRCSRRDAAATVNLSGGNQQKVVLGKWLFSKPELLILDEPTRGIDVGAKFEIYSIMAALADEGKCILMISSEMPELLGMCDRIYVMNEGRFVGEFASADASQEKIMRAIVKQGLA